MRARIDVQSRKCLRWDSELWNYVPAKVSNALVRLHERQWMHVDVMLSARFLKLK